MIVKYNADLTILEHREIGGVNDRVMFTGIASLSDNNVVIVGNHFNKHLTFGMTMLLEITPNFNIGKERKFSAYNRSDRFINIVTDKLFNVYCVGSETECGNHRSFLLKFDRSFHFKDRIYSPHETQWETISLFNDTIVMAGFIPDKQHIKHNALINQYDQKFKLITEKNYQLLHESCRFCRFTTNDHHLFGCGQVSDIPASTLSSSAFVTKLDQELNIGKQYQLQSRTNYAHDITSIENEVIVVGTDIVKVSEDTRPWLASFNRGRRMKQDDLSVIELNLIGEQS